MVIGVGDPGGACRTCPLNEWGTAKAKEGQDGRGKACKEYKLLVMQFPDKITQSIVMVPPTSLRRLKHFLLDLLSEGLAYHEVAVELRLEKETKGGYPTAMVAPKKLGELPGQLHDHHFQALVDRYRSMFEDEQAAAPEEEAAEA